MLTLHILGRELFNEQTGEFLQSKERTLQLEHSLLSLKKWESKHAKPFLGKDEKTREETLDYIRCMTINSDIPIETYMSLSEEHFKQIKTYIDAPMTATTFSKEENSRHSREIITSEIVYYWMISNNIPFECQKWHLNSLLTLIRVCNIKNAPPKKMGRKATMRNNAQLNAARRNKMNTKG